MSVKLHESYCLDSIQDRCDGFDHFWGDSLDARWTSTLGGGGTGAVVDGVDGGICRLSTPTASDSATLTWNNIRSLHVNKKVSIEARVRANGGVTDTFRLLLGLFFDASNRINFYQSEDSSDIYIRCRDGGSQTALDSGINIDTAFHVYRIETSTTAVHFYIDGVETANSPIITNIPDDAGDYLQPYVGTSTNADTDPATSMDIDYVWWRMNR